MNIRENHLAIRTKTLGGALTLITNAARLHMSMPLAWAGRPTC